MELVPIKTKEQHCEEKEHSHCFIQTNSIKIEITIIFGHEACHYVCYYHLKKNMVTTFHNKVINEYLRKEAYACNEREFEENYSVIKQLNERAIYYLKNWSRSKCKKDKYNFTTSNNVEHINTILKEARDIPIKWLMKEIR